MVSPRLWLSVGVFCFGMSVLVGYHQDQLAAKSVLAYKIGLPAEALIQEFSPENHTNIIGEVHLLAEAAFDRSTRLNVGNEDKPRWVHVVPVFAVGRESRPLAEHYIAKEKGLARRPVLRSEAAALAAKNVTPQINKQPLGAIIQEDVDQSPISPELLGSKIIGGGAHGPLVEIVGVQLHSSMLESAAANALVAKGMELPLGAMMLSPYSQGRESALNVQDYSTLRNQLVLISFLIVAFASASMFSLLPQLPRRRSEKLQSVEPVGVFPAVFQPIRTQEEIVRADEQAERPSRTRRVLSRVVSTN